MTKLNYASLTALEQDYLFMLDGTPNYSGIWDGGIAWASQYDANVARQDIGYNHVPYSMDMVRASYLVSDAVRQAVASYVRPVTGNARYTPEEKKDRLAALKAKDQAMVANPRWNGTVAQQLAKARLRADQYGQ